MIARKTISSMKPDIIVTVDGKKWKIEQKTSLKTIVIEFNLDEVSEYDPGSGTVGKYFNSLDGNKLVTKSPDTNEVISTREFTGSGLVQTYFAKGGVSGTRTWKKA